MSVTVSARVARMKLASNPGSLFRILSCSNIRNREPGFEARMKLLCPPRPLTHLITSRHSLIFSATVGLSTYCSQRYNKHYIITITSSPITSPLHYHHYITTITSPPLHHNQLLHHYIITITSLPLHHHHYIITNYFTITLSPSHHCITSSHYIITIQEYYHD